MRHEWSRAQGGPNTASLQTTRAVLPSSLRNHSPPLCPGPSTHGTWEWTQVGISSMRKLMALL